MHKERERERNTHGFKKCTTISTKLRNPLLLGEYLFKVERLHCGDACWVPCAKPKKCAKESWPLHINV